jgi:hypothetical protein
MVLLSEWNDGAIAILAVVFLIPATIIFLLLLMLLQISSKAKNFLDLYKKQKPIVYYALLVLLYIIAAAITIGIGSMF